MCRSHFLCTPKKFHIKQHPHVIKFFSPKFRPKQGCIPVGCVPPTHLLACRLLVGNKGSGVCLFTTIQNKYYRMTDACKNITFARFATRAVIITNRKAKVTFSQACAILFTICLLADRSSLLATQSLRGRYASYCNAFLLIRH